MPLSLNEIRTRAASFAREWADAFDEDAEAKSFWDDFFRVFGQERRQVAMFEKLIRIHCHILGCHYLLPIHQTLDNAVNKCYRKEPFQDERERIEYLFGLYEKYTGGLLAVEKVKESKKKAHTITNAS
jgi:hypothetical protein